LQKHARVVVRFVFHHPLQHRAARCWRAPAAPKQGKGYWPWPLGLA
jgi:hypothetical protein